MVGYGPKSYFAVAWNRFDFFLVTTSYIGYVTNLPSFTTLLRVFRIMRILRLVRGSKAMFQVRDDVLGGHLLYCSRRRSAHACCTACADVCGGVHVCECCAHVRVVAF